MNTKKTLTVAVILITLTCGNLILNAQADNAALDESEKTLLAIKVIPTIDLNANLLLVILKNDSPKEVMVNILSIRSPGIGIATGSFDKSRNHPVTVAQTGLTDTSLKDVILNGTKINVLEETERPLGAGQSISVSYDLSAIKEKISDILEKYAPERKDDGQVRINIKFRDLLSPPLKGMPKHTSSIGTPFVDFSMN